MAARFGRRKDRNGEVLPLYETRSSAHMDDLEGINEDRIANLTGKVQSLKSLTMNIGTEITSSTKLMDTMNESYFTTKNVLKGTMGRLNKVSKSSGISIWTWLVFFCIVALVFVLVRY
ncbi:SNARE Bet1 [Schizosaccharomyces cryophilus OY26]|uniref:SNARE Bet1 n=1 Tax=Schizosaccharomyces cryophilus (strain OY26 / ATCC MYA-4695 / CBS 11777 / NBRC 106824 / NRRL Y48691) TaxID=653667 RepID=S9XAL0_SCHCR|nr:SNARE Bet1 [Schizosaccharomyces cryophilus OY26]EPY50796.1 SNARE Bet1 [Schizosaccharomyces cryophilus OY26]